MFPSDLCKSLAEEKITQTTHCELEQQEDSFNQALVHNSECAEVAINKERYI